MTCGPRPDISDVNFIVPCFVETQLSRGNPRIVPVPSDGFAVRRWMLSARWVCWSSPTRASEPMTMTRRGSSPYHGAPFAGCGSDDLPSGAFVCSKEHVATLGQDNSDVPAFDLCCGAGDLDLIGRRDRVVSEVSLEAPPESQVVGCDRRSATRGVTRQRQGARPGAHLRPER